MLGNFAPQARLVRHVLHSPPMSAIRLPLLCAFAGGCLSSAVLFGIWRAEGGAAAPAQPARAQNAERVTASLVAPQADQRSEASDDTASADAQREPARVESADRKAEPPAASDAADVASALPTPGSSAVSDVLTDLEAAYRQRLIAAARAEAEAAAPPAAPAPAEPPREVATQMAAPPAAAVAPVSAPVVPPPADIPPPPSVPPVAAPVLVAQNDVRPPDNIHVGDINQNTYNITNVRQGDVYVTQQLAMLQYLQLLGASNPGLAQPTHSARGVAQRQAPQFRQFPSTLTNLDNPWGFNFAPPHLVH